MRALFVAHMAKEHLNRFHLPTIRALQKRGWVVDCASNGDEKVPFVDHEYQMSWKRTPFTTATFKGISELKNLLKNEYYDIIYCHTPVGGLVARIAAKNTRKKGTKVVYCPHGLHFYKGAPAKNWLLYYPVEKWLAGKSDAIFTVNQEDYELAKEKFTRKGCQVELVPEVGINIERLKVDDSAAARAEVRERYRIPADAFVMIYIAELNENKNQGMLIRALKLLCDQGKNAHLMLVGLDHFDGKYNQLAEELGVAERVTFTGWQSGIGELLYAADVCTASSFREGFGINLAEAMYCGLPAIATDNRGHRCIIQDGKNGFLVPVNDAEQMANRVSELMDDPGLYKKYSNQDATQFDAEVIAEELADRLEEIAGEDSEYFTKKIKEESK